MDPDEPVDDEDGTAFSYSYDAADMRMDARSPFDRGEQVSPHHPLICGTFRAELARGRSPSHREIVRRRNNLVDHVGPRQFCFVDITCRRPIVPLATPAKRSRRCASVNSGTGTKFAFALLPQ